VFTKGTVKAGKFVDQSAGSSGRGRRGKSVGEAGTDFSRLGKNKSNLKGIAALALLLGISTGAEEFIRRGVNNYFNKDASDNPKYKMQLIDEILEKVASNKYDNYANRMVVHGVVRPAVGTLGFVAAALALNKIFKLDERYGRLKFEASPTDRKGSAKLAKTISEEIVSLANDFGMIEKEASVGKFIDHLAGKLRTKIESNPHLKEINEFLAIPKRKKDTEEDLAYIITEEGPREVVRRAIYLSPFAAFGFDPRIRSHNNPESKIASLNLDFENIFNEEVNLLEKIGDALGNIEDMDAEERKEVDELLHSYKKFREGKKYLQRMHSMESLQPMEEALE